MVNNPTELCDLTVPGPAPVFRRMDLRAFLIRNAPELPSAGLLRDVATNDPEALADWVLKVMKDFMWRPAGVQPRAGATRPGESIALLGVVDDPAYCIGDQPEPFVDVVHFWPHENRWTITHCTRAGGDAVDRPVKVAAWKPLDQLPPPWSRVWA